MNTRREINFGYLIIAFPALVIGGVLALFVTNAIPRMMKRMMAGMIENMRDQMRLGGCTPDDM